MARKNKEQEPTYIAYLKGPSDEPIFDNPESSNLTLSITFGEQVENHAGMQKIGALAKNGLTVKDLHDARLSKLVKANTEYINLVHKDMKELKGQEAEVMIIRDGVDLLLGEGTKDALFREMASYPYDTKAKMRGRVVNKRARWNNCFADFSQEPDFEEGKGTIINFSDTKIVKDLREKWTDMFPENKDVIDLLAETNLYYDLDSTYIGFHGDTERKIVICVRLGDDLPLHYQWFQESKPIGPLTTIEVNHGDIYIMSEKAVGFDWKKKKVPTLRHAAGKPEIKELGLTKVKGEWQLKEKKEKEEASEEFKTLILSALNDIFIDDNPVSAVAIRNYLTKGKAKTEMKELFKENKENLSSALTSLVAEGKIEKIERSYKPVTEEGEAAEVKEVVTEEEDESSSDEEEEEEKKATPLSHAKDMKGHTPTAECVKVEALRKKYSEDFNLRKWVNLKNHKLVTRSGRVAIKGGKTYAYKASPWANPYPVGKQYTLKESLKLYEQFIRDKMYNKLYQLKDKVLGCFCLNTEECHTKVLIKLYNEYVDDTLSGKIKQSSPRQASARQASRRQASARKQVSKRDNGETCKAIKKDGTRCTFKAKENGYCGIHKPK